MLLNLLLSLINPVWTLTSLACPCLQVVAVAVPLGAGFGIGLAIKDDVKGWYKVCLAALDYHNVCFHEVPRTLLAFAAGLDCASHQTICSKQC